MPSYNLWGEGGGGEGVIVTCLWSLKRSTNNIIVLLLKTSMSLVWHPFPLLKSCGHSIYLFICFPSKVLAFETSLPIRISIDPLWGAYWHCLEPHIENHTFEYHKCWLVTKKHIIWFDVFILFNFLQVLLQQHSSKTKGILSYEIKIRDCFLVRYIWGIWFSFPLFIIFFLEFLQWIKRSGILYRSKQITHSAVKTMWRHSPPAPSTVRYIRGCSYIPSGDECH